MSQTDSTFVQEIQSSSASVSPSRLMTTASAVPPPPIPPIMPYQSTVVPSILQPIPQQPYMYPISFIGQPQQQQYPSIYNTNMPMTMNMGISTMQNIQPNSMMNNIPMMNMNINPNLPTTIMPTTTELQPYIPPIVGDDDDYEDPEEKQKNLVPMYGNLTNFNINNLLYNNIMESHYFRALYQLRTYHEVLQEIKCSVVHVEPWQTGTTRIPSSAYCLLLKLFLMKLTYKQMMGLLSYTQNQPSSSSNNAGNISALIRATGFLYLRYILPPADLWKWYEPYLEDDEEIQPSSDKNIVMTIGEYCIKLLTDMSYYGTTLPRIPVLVERKIRVMLLLLEQKQKRRIQNLKLYEKGRFEVGTSIRAIYSDEENEPAWYEAIIESIEDERDDTDTRHSSSSSNRENNSKSTGKECKFWVKFTEYGNTECVDLGDMELLKPTAAATTSNSSSSSSSSNSGIEDKTTKLLSSPSPSTTRTSKDDDKDKDRRFKSSRDEYDDDNDNDRDERKRSRREPSRERRDTKSNRDNNTTDRDKDRDSRRERSDIDSHHRHRSSTSRSRDRDGRRRCSPSPIRTHTHSSTSSSTAITSGREGGRDVREHARDREEYERERMRESQRQRSSKYTSDNDDDNDSRSRGGGDRRGRGSRRCRSRSPSVTRNSDLIDATPENLMEKVLQSSREASAAVGKNYGNRPASYKGSLALKIDRFTVRKRSPSRDKNSTTAVLKSDKDRDRERMEREREREYNNNSSGRGSSSSGSSNMQSSQMSREQLERMKKLKEIYGDASSK